MGMEGWRNSTGEIPQIDTSERVYPPDIPADLERPWDFSRDLEQVDSKSHGVVIVHNSAGSSMPTTSPPTG